jgi:5'-3' exonuclease
MKRWILIDVSNVLWKLYHGLGAAQEIDTRFQRAGGFKQILFNFLYDTVVWQKQFRTHRVAFFFDVGEPLRTKIFREYKWKQKKDKDVSGNPNDQKNRTKMAKFKIELRKEVLKELGFRNVFAAEGFEADDLIAAFCYSNIREKNGDEAIIISTDTDFFQLLSHHVKIFNHRTKEIQTISWFREKYNIAPKRWPLVKAIAGDLTDSIPNISRGIGPITALKYIRRELHESTPSNQVIESNAELIERNLKLTTIPLMGTPKPLTRTNAITYKSWCKAVGRLGLPDLKNHVPLTE